MKNVLELLASEGDRIGDVLVLAPFPQCRHFPIICEYYFQGMRQMCRPHNNDQRLWNRGKYSRISEELSVVDWVSLFSYSSVDEDCAVLESILRPLIHRHVPPKTLLSRPPWATKAPRALLRERADAWQRYKDERKVEGRNAASALEMLHIFNEINWRYRNFSVASRSLYEMRLLEKDDNRKLFHAYVRSKKIGCPTVGPLRLPGT
jgi:hypothetical protein